MDSELRKYPLKIQVTILNQTTRQTNISPSYELENDQTQWNWKDNSNTFHIVFLSHIKQLVQRIMVV